MKVLKQGDEHSEVWRRLKAHIVERLEMLRLKNDGALNPEETARIRGQIAELKYIADLDKPDPQIEADAHIL